MIVCDSLAHAPHVNRCDELHVEFMNTGRRVGWTARLNTQVFETRDLSVAAEPEVAAASVTCVTLRSRSRVETLYNSAAPARSKTGVLRRIWAARGSWPVTCSHCIGARFTNFEFEFV
jgi:hypothetical protein